jgi:hypothetical protein
MKPQGLAETESVVPLSGNSSGKVQSLPYRSLPSLAEWRLTSPSKRLTSPSWWPTSIEVHINSGTSPLGVSSAKAV